MRELFDVRSFLISHVNTPFPWKSIWHNKVCLRVTFFAWLDALGNIFPMNNLRKK
jgi:hypothetical protein